MAAMNRNIASAKQRLPLPTLMDRLDLGKHAKKSAKCPFHDDRHTSFSVFQKDGLWFWKCFASCGHGDEIDFLEKNAATMTIRQLALALKRTYMGVQLKAHRMSIDLRGNKMGANAGKFREIYQNAEVMP